MNFKKVSGVAFVIAFLMAIVLFEGIGWQYISVSTAKIVFLVSGAIGLLFNLLSFQSGKSGVVYNFFFWFGSILLFIGFTFKIMHWSFASYLIIGGLIVIGVSFVLPSNAGKKEKSEDLLDDF